jgi:hypothetical protein
MVLPSASDSGTVQDGVFVFGRNQSGSSDQWILCLQWHSPVLVEGLSKSGDN